MIEYTMNHGTVMDTVSSEMKLVLLFRIINLSRYSFENSLIANCSKRSVLWVSTVTGITASHGSSIDTVITWYFVVKLCCNHRRRGVRIGLETIYYLVVGETHLNLSQNPIGLIELSLKKITRTFKKIKNVFLIDPIWEKFVWKIFVLETERSEI